MRLLHYANKCRVKTQDGWAFPEWFSVPQAQLMADLEIKHRNTLYKIRDELVAAGFVQVKNANGQEPTRYRLTVSDTEQQQKAAHTVQQAGSFETNDFFMAAVKNSFREDIDMSLFKK